MKITKNYDLTTHNTFGLTAKATHFCVLENESQLPEICCLEGFDAQKTLWLGGGSNIIFTGKQPYWVVQIANKGIQTEKHGNQVWVCAQAGEIWHDFVQKTLDMGLSGLENLSLIPGTVGAAPVQNIGAYGVEVKDRIVKVRCFDLQTRQFIELNNEDCHFAYRESVFKREAKGRLVITAVTFALDAEFIPNICYGDLAAVVQQKCNENQPTAKDVAAAVCQIRSEKLPDPQIMGNAGSFFKNPVVEADKAAILLQENPHMPHYPQGNDKVKLAAAWLIDQCGLKGYQVGGAAVHEKQALVLVNKNQASAADVVALSQEICHRVAERFGVELECEPNWI